MRSLIVVAAAVLTVAACQPAASSVSVAGSVHGADTTWISIQRTPCFGTCPVYTMRIADTGAVEFDGTRFVQTIGRAQGSITTAEFAALRAAFDRAAYTTLKPHYIFGDPECANYATDMPTVITSITTAGKTTRVEHYHGCSGAPPQLDALEMKIDSIARVSRWIGERSR